LEFPFLPFHGFGFGFGVNMSKKSNSLHCDSEYLFDAEILKRLDFTDTSCWKKNNISVNSPGENLKIRPLHIMDYHKEYPALMSELTVVGDVSDEKFQTRFKEMRSCSQTYFIVIIEDTSLNKCAGSGTLVIEKHLNRKVKLVNRGRVEDIVVLASHRGRQLGKLMLETLVLLGKNVGCDEISLECKDPLIRFYNQFGFVLQKNENYMQLRYENKDH